MKIKNLIYIAIGIFIEKNKPNFTYNIGIGKKHKKSQKKFVSSFFCSIFASETKNKDTMFTFIRTRKIEKQAQNIYREMWEKGLAVTVTSEDKYNNIIRLNCGRFQLHIEDNELAGKCRWHAISEIDSRTSKIFAIALACSNNGAYYSKYAHLVNRINLDGINENIF